MGPNESFFSQNAFGKARWDSLHSCGGRTGGSSWRPAASQRATVTVCRPLASERVEECLRSRETGMGFGKKSYDRKWFISLHVFSSVFIVSVSIRFARYRFVYLLLFSPGAQSKKWMSE